VGKKGKGERVGQEKAGGQKRKERVGQETKDGRFSRFGGKSWHGRLAGVLVLLADEEHAVQE
jgi:hypothetical protein